MEPYVVQIRQSPDQLEYVVFDREYHELEFSRLALRTDSRGIFADVTINHQEYQLPIVLANTDGVAELPSPDEITYSAEEDEGQIN